MPITGSQPALMYSQSGVERCGATRSGYHSAHAFVTVGGTLRRTSTLMDSLTITDEIDEAPNRCRFTVKNFVPTEGQEVIVMLGSTHNRERLFAGQILHVKQRQEAYTLPVLYDVDAIDYTWRADKLKVTARYTNTSASTIAQTLVSTYAAGFTSANVVAGLDTIDEISFTNEDLSTALTRLAKRIGAYWYWDYLKDLHFFITEVSNGTPVALTSTNVSFRAFEYDRDLSQVATRAIVEGRGSPITLETPIGSPTLPVEDATPFDASGGSVSAPDCQILTYTGLRAGQSSYAVARPAPANTPVLSDITPGGAIGGSTYTVKVAFLYADGSESMPSAASNALVCAANHTWSLASLEVGPTGVSARRIYVRQESGIFAGTYAFFNLVNDNTTTSFNSTTVNAGGTTSGSPITTAQTYNTGDTSVFVADTAQFESAGGSARALDYAPFTYTARSTSSGLGALTGIPSSGVGSLWAGINPNDPVMNTHPDRLPALTGIPASGTGAITTIIGAGADVYLRVQRDDTAAQTALATLIGDGDDGIRETYLQDRRLSQTEAEARGDALLSLFSAAEASIRYTSRDLRTRAGKTITVTLGGNTNVSADFKIQHVTVTGFRHRATTYPTYAVEASTTRFSFEDLVRTLRKAS